MTLGCGVGFWLTGSDVLFAVMWLGIVASSLVFDLANERRRAARFDRAMRKRAQARSRHATA